MISKRVLGPALTGTGAVGASGTLAWTLGLLDEEILDDVVDVKVDSVESKPKPQEKAPSSPEGSAKQAEAAKESRRDVAPNETRGGQKTQTGANRESLGATNTRKGGSSTWRSYFATGTGVSEYDKKAIKASSTLKVESKNQGLQSLWVKAEGDSTWECRLKAITIGTGLSPNSEEFERQRAKLENALKKEEHKKLFVANCSRTRLEGEKVKGEESAIELETEQADSWNKFKFKEKGGYFERLWTEDFYGVDRVKKEDEWFLEKENVNHWSIKTEEESKTKIKITATLNKDNKEWKCNISRDSTRDPGEKTFKDDELGEILGISTLNYGKEEKKRYLIRNCAKNKGEIKGLKIKVYGSNWRFDDDSLEKITEGMYENPKAT